MEWGDEQERLLKFMIHGQASSQKDDQDSTTLDLLGSGGSCSSSSTITSGPGLDLGLDMELPRPPSGWDKRLDLKNGKFYYVHLSSGTSSYHHPANAQTSNLPRELEHITTKPMLGLEDLELSLGTVGSERNGLPNIQSVKKALEASSKWRLQQMPGQGKLGRPMSSSCDYSSTSCCSSESSSSSSGDCNHVLLTSCKRCIMYVMIDRVNPTCPKCSGRLVTDDLHVPKVKKPRTGSCNY